MVMKLNFIIDLVLYVLLLPFYIFAFYKWYEWRDHCMFRYRYAKEGTYIILIAIIETHVLILQHILHDSETIPFPSLYNDIFDAINYVLFWCIYFLIWYRANLIFLTWKQYQRKLNQMKINIHLTENTCTENVIQSPYKHFTSKLLLILMISGAIIILSLYLTPFRNFIIGVYIINYIVGIITLLAIKINKVKEMMNCLFEIYTIFVFCILFWITVFVFPNDETYFWPKVQAIISSNIFALIILYMALYILYKYEGTLTKKNSTDVHMMEYSAQIGSVT
eukprot:423382_1